MAEPTRARPLAGWIKAAVVGLVGLGGGVVATYANAVIDRVAKPARPVANFAVSADGLTISCRNHATGESGWWDFGDGTPLEPFDPNQPELKHTYAKPGSYAVKLIVRNFVSDENERSVPVDLAATARDTPPPAVLAFAVQPVSPVSIAPATFRVTADVQNAASCVWDFGDGRLEVVDAAGKVDRLVTFDKPGTFPLQLVAHNGKQAVKQASAVVVEAPKEGTLMAVLTVTDTGNRVDRLTVAETVTVPVPGGKAGAGFARTIAAKPGYLIAEAVPTNPHPPGVKNLKVQITADRKSVAVSGEWAGDPKAAVKAAGGSDLIVPLKLIEERTTVMQRPPAAVAAVITQSRIVLPLPPVPAGWTGHARQYRIELRQAGRPQPLLQAPAAGSGSVALPWSGLYTADGKSWVFSVAPDGGQAVVSLTPATR